jgi:uncharacterized damage-inducible protein DinB
MRNALFRIPDQHARRVIITTIGGAMPGQAPPHTEEKALLLAYIDQQRDGLRFAAYGLTDEQARLTPTAGTLSIGGLVKHVTAMERSWMDTTMQRERSRAPADYEAGFRLGPDETLVGALADLDAAAHETEATVAALDLDRPVPVPQGVPWFPDDIDAWSVRWVLLHLVEEIARHSGHADIVRETIDGATMYELMAGAEGWPATTWLQPWQPPT